MWTAIPKVLAALLIGVLSTAATAQTGSKKPNILVIWGDDIGINNISAYNLGVMGYQTPSIDRIAKEGALFTDAYAWQSCTAGRASFILGEHPVSDDYRVPFDSPARSARSRCASAGKRSRPRSSASSTQSAAAA